jgi:hypothetical protein
MSAQPTTDREWELLMRMIQGIDEKLDRRIDRLEETLERRDAERAVTVDSLATRVTTLETQFATDVAARRSSASSTRTMAGVIAFIVTTLISLGGLAVQAYTKDQPVAQVQARPEEMVRPDCTFVNLHRQHDGN